jgi:hypothetical protein
MKWSFKNNKNAEEFRRSMLPFYLLKDDSGSKHPRYIEQSTLSQNLSENTSISLTIYISKDIQKSMENAYTYVKEDNRGMGLKSKKTLHPSREGGQRQVIKMEKFYLLQTAQSLIDQTIQELYKKYQTDNLGRDRSYEGGKQRQKHHIDSDEKILKFKNQEAYLYGETQLIYFSDVRESLKTNQEIELVLINVDNDMQGVSK